MRQRQRQRRRRRAGHRQFSFPRFLQRNGFAAALLAVGLLLVGVGAAILAGDHLSGQLVLGLLILAAAPVPVVVAATAPLRRRRRFRRVAAETCDDIVAEVAQAGIHDIEIWLRGTRH